MLRFSYYITERIYLLGNPQSPDIPILPQNQCRNYLTNRFSVKMQTRTCQVEDSIALSLTRTDIKLISRFAVCSCSNKIPNAAAS